LDFLHFWKSLVGFCALFEVNNGILCIFGRFSWDFVHIWKLHLWFCAFLEVPRWILCIFRSSSWDCVYLRVPRGIVYILEVPPGILCIIRSKSWDFVHFWKILVEFCALFEVNHEILCIFGRSS
jgi:hypothetical protein